MANNINQIKAAIEANLATIRDAYYAALNNDSSPEGVKTARANYATALKSAQLNARTLVNAQTPFEKGEYEAISAVTELGYSPSKFNMVKSSPPKSADVREAYGLPASGDIMIGNQPYKVLTQYSTDTNISEILDTLFSLSGHSVTITGQNGTGHNYSDFSDFLENTLIDGQPLAISTGFGLGVTNARNEFTPEECLGELPPCDCGYTLTPKGPNGEIYADNGEIYRPFDPITNPGGYVKEQFICDKSHTRLVSIICPGGTAVTLENIGYNTDGSSEGEYEPGGYEDLPIYDPSVPRDPTDPQVGLRKGMVVIGCNTTSGTKICSYRVLVGTEVCTITVEEHRYCDGVYVLSFSNHVLAKPCTWTPEWKDGSPPPGWCEAIKKYASEHPDSGMCIPVQCRGNGVGVMVEGMP